MGGVARMGMDQIDRLPFRLRELINEYGDVQVQMAMNLASRTSASLEERCEMVRSYWQREALGELSDGR